MVEKVQFSAGSNELVGHRVVGSAGDTPGVLMLHGAGEANKERSLPLAERLLSDGIGSFAFDFSGHGESTGELKSSSLRTRILEARSAMQFVDADCVAVCAFSMGAHIALELLRHYSIRALVLFYPAIYSERAVDLPFGAGFSDVIRQPDSWRDASVLNLLDDYTGTFLIVVGENDSVIPSGVISLLSARSKSAWRREVVQVDGAGHLLLQQLYQDEPALDEVAAKVAEYVRAGWDHVPNGDRSS